MIKKDFSRRNFLRGLGVLPLAALVPGEPLFAQKTVTAAGTAGAAKHPVLGALFNPYHRLEDWSLLGRQQPEGMPLLGSYASHAVGSVSTQIIWAKNMGVRFFLSAYCPNRPSEGVDALFEAAGRLDYKVGLYIDLQDNPSTFQQRPLDVRLTAALTEVASRYLGHPAYLRTASGLPVLAVAGLDDGTLLEAALQAAGSRQAWGPVLRFPAAWRATPDAQADPELHRAVNQDGMYLGFSARNGARASSRKIPCHSETVSALLVSPVRDREKGLRLPRVEASGTPYVILDSFNNWRASVPLEPGTVSRTAYGKHVAHWFRSLPS